MTHFGLETNLGALLWAAHSLQTPRLVVSRCQPGLNAAPAGDEPHAALAAPCGPRCRGAARHELVDVRAFNGLTFRERWRLVRWALQYEPDTVPRVKFNLTHLVDAMKAAGFSAAPNGRFKVRRRRLPL